MTQAQNARERHEQQMIEYATRMRQERDEDRERIEALETLLDAGNVTVHGIPWRVAVDSALDLKARMEGRKRAGT